MKRVLFVCVAAFLSACGSSGSFGAFADVSPSAAEPAMARAQAGQRTLIRRADMSVNVPRLDRALVRTSHLVGAAGGSVEREAISDRTAHLVIRVPESSLGATADSLGELGKVTRRSLSTDDATARSINLEARIAALAASRDRLRALIERARSVEEVIVVERELARVQGELEDLEGQQRHLRDRAAMATLGLSLEQPPKLGPVALVAKGAQILIQKLFVLD